MARSGICYSIISINILLIFTCAILVIIPTKCHATKLAEDKIITSLFIFGDSLFDVGNNNYINTPARANFFPYGQTFFHYPTGRFSDGRLIPDFIAELAKLPLIAPYLQRGGDNYDLELGVNFASAGAGALTETHPGLVIDLKTQLSYFKNASQLLRQNLGETKARTLLSRAVYLFSIGNNDYSYIFETNSSVLRSHSPKQFVQLVIGNITQVIQEIYEMGGRKFGILGLGPLGCTPGARIIGQGGCFKSITPYIKQHNKQLSELLKRLLNELEGFKYSLVRVYAHVEDIINQPSKYGFKEGKVACCGSGPYRGIGTCGRTTSMGVREYELCDNASDYVFFDSGHPSERFSQILAKKAWTSGISRPYTLKALFESK